MKNQINSITSIATLNENGTIYVLKRKVACRGNNEPFHPLVTLLIKNSENPMKDEISCPYCKQIFIYKKKTNAGK